MDFIWHGCALLGACSCPSMGTRTTCSTFLVMDCFEGRSSAGRDREPSHLLSDTSLAMAMARIVSMICRGRAPCYLMLMVTGNLRLECPTILTRETSAIWNSSALYSGIHLVLPHPDTNSIYVLIPNALRFFLRKNSPHSTCRNKELLRLQRVPHGMMEGYCIDRIIVHSACNFLSTSLADATLASICLSISSHLDYSDDQMVRAIRAAEDGSTAFGFLLGSAFYSCSPDGHSKTMYCNADSNAAPEIPLGSFQSFIANFQGQYECQ